MTPKSQGKEDKLRLGDFWQLRLFRPTRAEVLRQCRVAIRTAQFREAARPGTGGPGGRLRALALLQQRLGAVVDHKDEKEERQVGTDPNILVLSISNE